MAKLSIMGLYNFNESVFDGFKVPEGVDRQTCINEIVLECAELEVIYPSFNTMKLAISNWSKIELPIWNRLNNTELLKYNPLWNVDGDVIETRSVERAKTGTNNQNLEGSEEGENSDSRTISGSDQTSGTSETTTSKPGYNSNDLVITEKQNGTTSGTSTTSTTDAGSGTNSVARSQQITGSDSENETVGETLHTRRTGNIGVTSSQQLLREERDVAVFSTIKYIVNSFKKRFCLLVY